MLAVRRTPLLEFLWKVHRWVYVRSNGLVGSRIGGMPVLLLTTTGRKTGRSHTTALQYLPEGESYVVIASNAGEPRYPAWYLNVKARPEAVVQRGRRRMAVLAREVEGEERRRLWARALEVHPAYAVYQNRTTRCIPIVVLDPESRVSLH